MPSPSQDVRQRLEHPVIDTDGHVLEYTPAAMPFLREALGADLFERYRARGSGLSAILGGMDIEDRARTRTPQASWWGTTANTLDLATASIPRLLHSRLDEFGIDYAVLYPTFALGSAGLKEDELRQGVCRGFNDFVAEIYGPYADRLTVAGTIPMHTPQEAVAELEHCHRIGLKVVGIPEGVMRPIPEPRSDNPSPWLMPNQTHWFDTYGLDSAYDYDPVWRKFQELGFAVTSHVGIGDLTPNNATSYSNYVHNHIGQFSMPMFNLCKSLFLGGVTRRFPTLNVAFLECGVNWACSLLDDLVEHWEKRNVQALHENLDPSNIDWRALAELFEKHGQELLDHANSLLEEGLETLIQAATAGVPVEKDDWRFVEIESEEDIRDLFVPRFFFGCEADDGTISFAFSDANAFGAQLQPVFASDIGHWDVTDMTTVLAESFELVEDGVLTESQYRDFVFTNPAKLYLGANPDFFAGTSVESATSQTKHQGNKG